MVLIPVLDDQRIRKIDAAGHDGQRNLARDRDRIGHFRYNQRVGSADRDTRQCLQFVFRSKRQCHAIALLFRLVIYTPYPYAEFRGFVYQWVPVDTIAGQMRLGAQ